MEALMFVIVIYLLVIIGYYAGQDKTKEGNKKQNERDLSESYLEGFKDGYNSRANEKVNIENDKYKNICAGIMNDLNELRQKIENNEKNSRKN